MVRGLLEMAQIRETDLHPERIFQDHGQRPLPHHHPLVDHVHDQVVLAPDAVALEQVVQVVVLGESEHVLLHDVDAVEQEDQLAAPHQVLIQLVFVVLGGVGGVDDRHHGHPLRHRPAGGKIHVFDLVFGLDLLADIVQFGHAFFAGPAREKTDLARLFRGQLGDGSGHNVFEVAERILRVAQVQRVREDLALVPVLQAHGQVAFLDPELGSPRTWNGSL